MKKNQNLFFIFCALFTVILTLGDCETSTYLANSQRYRLRSFGIYSLKILSDLTKSYEQQQQLHYEKLQREELQRRKLIQKYLDTHHKSESFFTDFHPNRLF